MTFKQWLETEDGKAVMEAIREHVSYASRNIIEQSLRAAFVAGELAGMKRMREAA